MFEIIKGERDYVADLELVLQLFIDGLRSARPEIMPKTQLSSFIIDVFSNIQEILDLHRQLLNALFERQREQHPLLQTIGDIILDKTIRTEFRSAYESYIMHYPLAESFHRKELKRNGAYEKFIHSISNDPRVRKRDLITFLSRPVTRLPRLNLLLEETLKSTEKDFEHPDLETLPLILGILRDCIKSTQPGIEAAESKVQFWQLCESLIYKKGEIIDMDLYDQSRTLVYSSPAARRIRSDAGFQEWDDLEASLLDNYRRLSFDEAYTHTHKSLINRSLKPIHLSFLRLGSFSDASITRKEKLEGGLLDSLRSQSVPIFPFTIFHSYSRSTRRYTLYVTSESLRKKWKNALSEASALHRLREDSNKWFDPQNVTSSFFSAPVEIATPTRSSGPTGRITSAVPFIFSERKFLAVGCSTGIFVSVAGHEDFKRVLHYSNPTYMAALQTAGSKVYNRFVVYYESTIVSHSLDLLARLTLGQTTREILEASSERIGGSESNITFCKSVQIGDRALVVYASKRRLSSSLTLQVMEAVDRTEMEGLRQKRTNTRVLAFRPFGEPGFIPRDAFDITALTKNIAICTQDGIVIANPTNLAESAVTVVPDLRDAASSVSMSILKERLKDAKPLGLARVDSNELLVIYDSVGCYITKLGVPSRSCGYIRWEIQASGNINTGRIAQVIEGTDVRLMYTGFGTDDRDDRVLVAMRGSKNDKDGTSAERIVELIETVEYAPQSTVSTVPDVWDEWDM
ncbi:Rho1 guanine nucleotide exchange factor 3 [Leucoagaricus sp. SymC.cos]|nr:Rho1 guanine nucleotide exchange factor 3 [Leucoagaricus sp. SymC.cos]